MMDPILLAISIILSFLVSFIFLYSLQYGMMPWEFITEPLGEWYQKKKEKQRNEYKKNL